MVKTVYVGISNRRVGRTFVNSIIMCKTQITALTTLKPQNIIIVTVYRNRRNSAEIYYVTSI